MSDGDNSLKVALLLVGVLIACLLSFFAGFLVGNLTGSGLFDFIMDEGTLPEGVAVDFEFPQAATVGQAIDAVVTVTNGSTESITLVDFDLDRTLLEGFTIESIDPKPASSYTDEYFLSHNIQRIINPGDTFTCKATLTPTKAGDFFGDIDVYFDPNFVNISSASRITVND